MAVTPRDIEVQRLRAVVLAMGWEFRAESVTGDETLVTLVRRFPSPPAAAPTAAPTGT